MKMGQLIIFCIPFDGFAHCGKEDALLVTGKRIPSAPRDEQRGANACGE
jgi:hypothetical protein